MGEVELKPCPFCEESLDEFGHVVRDGVVITLYKHPVRNVAYENFCPLSGLVFDEPRWNKRPRETAILARVAELEAERKWIPVNEWIQEFNKPVMTIYSTFGGMGTHVIRCLLETGMWYDCGSGELCHPKNITHVMPLPKYPENA